MFNCLIQNAYSLVPRGLKFLSKFCNNVQYYLMIKDMELIFDIS